MRRIAVSPQITVDQSMVSAQRVGTNEIGLPDWRLEGPNFGLETYTAAETAGLSNPQERGGFAMPMNHNGAALSTRHPDGCSGLGQALGTAASLFYDQINTAFDDNQLNNMSRTVWHLYSQAKLSDDEATFLAAAIDKRRPRSVRTAPGFAKPLLGALRGRVGSIFPPRREQRSPDRQASYERRHRLAYSGVMPGHLAARITHGEMAVMSVVANMYRLQRFCDLSLAEIAARAGVCRKTAKRAMDVARHVGLISIEERPMPGRKNLTNVVRIISREWLAWLAKRRPALLASTGGHSVSPTSTSIKTDRELRVDNQARGLAKGRIARFGPASAPYPRRE